LPDGLALELPERPDRRAQLCADPFRLFGLHHHTGQFFQSPRPCAKACLAPRAAIIRQHGEYPFVAASYKFGGMPVATIEARAAITLVVAVAQLLQQAGWRIRTDISAQTESGRYNGRIIGETAHHVVQRLSTQAAAVFHECPWEGGGCDVRQTWAHHVTRPRGPTSKYSRPTPSLREPGDYSKARCEADQGARRLREKRRGSIPGSTLEHDTSGHHPQMADLDLSRARQVYRTLSRYFRLSGIC